MEETSNKQVTKYHKFQIAIISDRNDENYRIKQGNGMHMYASLHVCVICFLQKCHSNKELNDKKEPAL